MLSAREALQLHNDSLVALDKYLLENFHSQIRQAAIQGKRSYTFSMGAEEYSVPKLDPLQQKTFDELKKYGYAVSYGFYGEGYVPRGLSDDDDGNGPAYRNYGITVTW